MLNVPSTIQSLFGSNYSGVRKNFRVHFPNGEYSDITNESIVKESVKFTESLCSQSPFRFGLAEASVVEFETVGIGNMYGMLIECAYEIDTSSLSAAQISAIQTDPGDGTIVLVGNSDLGYGFYRIPLGLFRVESCPRNHEIMTHRQVTAYGYPNTAAFSVSPMQEWIFASPHQNATGTMDLFTFLAANIGFYNHAFIDQRYMRSVKYTASGMSADSMSAQIIATNAYKFTVSVSGLKTPALFPMQNTEILGFDDAGIDYEALNLWIKNIGSAYGFSSSVVGALSRCCGVLYSPGSYTIPLLSGKKFQGDVYCFCGWSGEASPLRHVFFPTQIEINLYNGSTLIETCSAAATGSPVLYSFAPAGTVPTVQLSLASTGKDLNDRFIYSGSVELNDLLAAYLELYGAFGQNDRAGNFAIKQLDRTSPVSVSAGDYENVWWDEYDVSPVGTVLATLQNANGEITASIPIGEGESVYEMTSNAALKLLANADEDSVAAIFSGDFADAAANIGFTPTELTMQGWPWLEAGDALEITAEDGTVVETYALRMEMTGIQCLEATITAAGGEIIGEA